MERWCQGQCERLLPLLAFGVNGPYRRHVCKACRRILERKRSARRYRRASGVRVRKLALARIAYAANPEPAKARVKARYWRLKLAEAVA